MTRPVHLCCVAALPAFVVLAAPIFAEERVIAAAGPTTARVAGLEARLRARQECLEQLEAEVAAARQRDADATRGEAIRQQIREILSEQEFREHLMPSILQAGYDKRFFIRSGDERFLLKVNGRMQFRWTHYGTRTRNRYLQPGLERHDRTGFDVQRIRLQFKGHMHSKDLTYLLQLRADSTGSYDLRLRYAWVNYRLADELQFKAGVFKLAGTRAQMTSSGSLQLVDRPMTDAVFSLGAGLGVRFWGRLFEKRVDWYLDIVNSLSDFRNRTITTDDRRELDGSPALVLHATWHALGDGPEELMKSQSDVQFHETPVLDLGVHYAFNDDGGDRRTLNIPFRRRGLLPGAFGRTTSNGLQVHQLGGEAAFQWHGFSATAECTLRLLDPRRAGRTPFAPYWLLTGEGSDSSHYGAYLQLGCFLPIPGLERKLEAVARIGGVGGIGPGDEEGAWEYAAGLNYFIAGHKVKLQTDLTRIYEAPVRSGSGSIANVNDDALLWRIQLQVKF